MQNKDQILQQIKEAVLKIDPRAEVVLFGSRARGDYHEESDWDVLILTDNSQNDISFRNRVRELLYEIELKEGGVISSVIKNREYWQDLIVTPLYQEVAKDGILL